MVKKKTHGRQGNHNHEESFTNPSSLRVVEYFDAERIAQRDEYFRQEKASLRFPKQSNKKPKPKAMSFEERLELTNLWLEETYPYLFAADDYVPLEHHLVRDLKAD
jgi:hypothetical protein